MKRLLQFLKPYRKEAILAPLFKMLEASFELFVPLVVAAMIDRGIGQKDQAYILRMGLLLLCLALIGLACSVTAQFFSARAAVGVSADLRGALYRHIQALSWKDLDDLGTSAMITRMTSDVNQVQTGVNLALRLLLRSPFVVIGAAVMAFTVDVRAAVVFVIVIPLLCIVVFSIMLFNIPMYRRVQAKLDSVLRDTRENLTGARVIRAFNRQQQEIEGYREDTGALEKIQLFAGRVSGLMNPVTYLIINAGIIILIYTGALRVNAGHISQGQLTALVNYMSQILVELIKMANLIISITKAAACANRIENVFDITPSMQYGTADIPAQPGDVPVLELKDAGICYHEGADPSISGITLCVREGETIGIIGGTGSGKSTLVNLISRFYDATQGQVLLYGQDIRSYSKEALRRLFGIVPQKNALFHATVEENLRWGRADASQDEIREALELAQAAQFVDEKPEGTGFMLEHEGRNLSGGQRQRLCIARTLIRKPGILILDDSTSALDYVTEANLRKAVRSLSPRPTTFIVSQRASSIRYADKIVVLDDGQCVGLGTHDELMRTCSVYQEIYHTQYSDLGAADQRAAEGAS